jgi:cysteine desulfurase
MNVIYLDNNATTRVADEVLEAMLPYFCQYYGNPASMHTFGGNVEKEIVRAKERIASLLGISDITEIVITSCGTESDNAAIRGTLESYPDKRHIVTTKVEHPAVQNVCKHLARMGYRVTELSVDGEGMLNLDELRDAITADTAIVSIMYANNETGVIFPIEEIGKIVKEKGSVFHVDAVQAVGKIPLNMGTSTIDLLSLSGHKLHGPKGVGTLYIRKGTRFKPFIIGGHQERGRRGGTENSPGIIGLGKACELAEKHIAEENTRVKALRDRLETALLGSIPNVRLNGHKTQRLPNTTNISFEFVEGEAILLLLDRHEIAASSGSACTSGSLEPSHVLRAMGIPFTFAHGSIRFSLSIYNTEKEINTVIEVMPGIIEKLRAISPYWKEAAAEQRKGGSELPTRKAAS